MEPMLIEHPRFLLRDLAEADRAAFLAYQMDPRYLALYDFEASDVRRASELFDLFAEWRETEPRRNFQIGIFDGRNGELCGCAGLRKSSDDTAVLGIELAPEKWGRRTGRIRLQPTAANYDHRRHRERQQACGETGSMVRREDHCGARRP